MEGNILNEKEQKKEERSDAWYMIAELGRQNKRVFTALITVIILWFATISGFVCYLSLYDITAETYDITSSDGGFASYVGNDGDIYNGTGTCN